MEKCCALFFIALWVALVDDSYRDTPQGTQKNPVRYVLEKHLFIAHCYRRQEKTRLAVGYNIAQNRIFAYTYRTGFFCVPWGVSR